MGSNLCNITANWHGSVLRIEGAFGPVHAFAVHLRADQMTCPSTVAAKLREMAFWFDGLPAEPAPSLKFYDAGSDEIRDATQEDMDRLQAAVQRMARVLTNEQRAELQKARLAGA